MPVEPLLTKRAAAGILGICVRSLEKHIAAGKLPVVKLGTAARIDPRDLAAFVEAQKQRGPA